jgi:hypothetical protein
MAKGEKKSKLSKKEKSTPREAAKSGGGKKKPKPRNTKGNKTPAWWFTTIKHCAFVAAAGRLSEALKRHYGEGFNIAQYERVLAELPTLSEEQKSLLVFPDALPGLYRAFKGAKEARDSERESFRSFRSVEAINAGLELAEGLATEAKQER